MKKFSLILSITLLLSSVFCIMAGATAGTVIESQELYAEIPQGYEFSPYYDDDLYFTFANEDNLLYIDMRENADVTDGIEALSQKELEKLIIVDFLLEGDEESAAECSIKFNDISIKNINGVKMCRFTGAYAWEDGQTPIEEDAYSGIGGYITATKEKVYFFILTEYETNFTQDELIDTFISTVAVNGTYFSGDKATVSKNFDSFETFSSVLSEKLNTYWAENEEYYDDSYYTESDYAEIGNITFGIGIIAVVVTVIPTLIVLIVAIILISKYNKNRKKINELEKQQFAGAYCQQGMPYQPVTQPVAQPYGAQQAQTMAYPYGAQPVQSVSQPIPQPVNTQAEAKTVLNGEIQDDNQQ